MFGSTSEFVGFKKHEVYYLNGGDVYFLVGECMFRVHRYFFERESSKFQQMFGGPTSLGVEPEGSSPDTAFRLSDITADDFAHFLWIFYNPTPSVYDASTDVWITILRTACKWLFPEVKALAIKELERKTVTLIDPVVLYENYRDDPSVLALLYAKLCSRGQPPTMEQSMCLGIETTVRIFHARERLRSSSIDRLMSPLPDGVDLADVIQVIDEIWEGDTICASGGDQVPILNTVATERQSEEQGKERARVTEAKAGAEAAAKPEESKVIKETSRIPSGLATLATPGPSVSAPRKTATATVPKIPAQPPTWQRAPQNTPVLARPSTLGQGIHVKDGVSIPRNNVGATKQGPAVSFGSIDDVSAPISSSPAATPPIKSEGVKTFGTVPATVSQVNGKSSVSIAKPGSSSSTPHKPRKQDIAKLFSNPSSAPPFQASSDTSSPNIRSSNLLPSSQPPSIPSSSHPPYPSFVPQNGMRPQQPNAGPNGGATGSGPRSPQYQRQVPNGNVPRIPSGPGGPGAPQMSVGLGSPRMTPHPPPANMPSPMQTQMSWPPNYYYMGDQPYMYPWYPMQQHQMPSLRYSTRVRATQNAQGKDKEASAEPEPVEMSDKDAKKKIEEDIEKFIAVRNPDEAEVYFTQLPAKHHPLLVDKLISFAVESNEADAQLVSEFFSRVSTKNLCTIVDFESGFAGVLEFLDDIAIDAPMAFKLMATMMKGPAFDDEQRTRLASKTDSAKLLGLLS
ncbi:uncharacterized protein ARMOST_01238 [Armillaria ostoyae]|uniref:BTB domain-containing protein n=1 Tax=Armillaria ostoyae TaxID=47428 RepID=A0A284QND6_ARMOS|nr:uncharacterized protein ARMOST_01238 [Armillaria ostoyae]